MESNSQWTEELNRISRILDNSPLFKTIKWGAEVFTYQGRNVVSYGGFKKYFALWFYNGVFLQDPYGVLINAQEGKTKSLRQWRMIKIDDMDAIKIMEYIKEAIEIEEKGLKIKTVIQQASQSALLENVLDKEVSLRVAFDTLSLAKQREYSSYIEEAKLEKTKLSRIEKIIPMILKVGGLNDKYKINCKDGQE